MKNIFLSKDISDDRSVFESVPYMGNGSSVNDNKKRREKRENSCIVAALSTVCFNSIRFGIRVVSCHCVA